jgi:hypothetical protein
MSYHRQKGQISDLNEDFSYPTNLLKSASAVVSPTKLTKKVSSTVPRKRKFKNAQSSNLEYNNLEEVVSWPETAWELPELGNSSIVGQTRCEELTAFEKYFDAVLSNCAGFFHISKDFFVVQGWDE